MGAAEKYFIYAGNATEGRYTVQKNVQKPVIEKTIGRLSGGIGEQKMVKRDIVIRKETDGVEENKKNS